MQALKQPPYLLTARSDQDFVSVTLPPFKARQVANALSEWLYRGHPAAEWHVRLAHAHQPDKPLLQLNRHRCRLAALFAGLAEEAPQSLTLPTNPQPFAWLVDAARHPSNYTERCSPGSEATLPSLSPTNPY